MHTLHIKMHPAQTKHMKKWLKFRKVIFATYMGIALGFAGCTWNARAVVDTTVDMTPRLIAAQTGLTTEEVVENVKGAVVGILASLTLGSSVGSGVAIAEGGYILTNHHVVNGATSMVVYFANKTQGAAKLIWSDPSMDLAIIQANQNMPYLECGTSTSLKVGQDVIAIGTPLTLQFKHTVTKGIVSALGRTLEVGSMSESVYLQNLIQHDASINPGNSGGPLISMDCKLVGINTLKADAAEGIGFAIPIEAGKAIATQTIANKTYKPAYVGMFGFDASIAAFYGETTNENGVFVVTVDSQSPAAKAGVQKGDVVVAVDGKKVDTVLDLRIALYGYQQGDRMTIKVLREGKEMLFEMNGGIREG